MSIYHYQVISAVTRGLPRFRIFGTVSDSRHNPAQPNPTSGSTQPMDNSGMTMMTWDKTTQWRWHKHNDRHVFHCPVNCRCSCGRHALHWLWLQCTITTTASATDRCRRSRCLRSLHHIHSGMFLVCWRRPRARHNHRCPPDIHCHLITHTHTHTH